MDDFPNAHPRLFTFIWVVTVLAVVTVILGLAYAFYLNAQTGGEKAEARYTACLEQGGTWLSGDCVFDQNGTMQNGVPR